MTISLDQNAFFIPSRLSVYNWQARCSLVETIDLHARRTPVHKGRSSARYITQILYAQFLQKTAATNFLTHVALPSPPIFQLQVWASANHLRLHCPMRTVFDYCEDIYAYLKISMSTRWPMTWTHTLGEKGLSTYRGPPPLAPYNPFKQMTVWQTHGKRVSKLLWTLVFACRHLEASNT